MGKDWAEDPEGHSTPDGREDDSLSRSSSRRKMGLSRLAIHFLSLLIRAEAREGNRVKDEEEKQES